MRLVHPPRPGDLPKKELVEMAERAIKAYGGPKVAEVHFKATCPACGARVTMDEPNTLHNKFECANCKEVSEFKVGGIVLHAKITS